MMSMHTIPQLTCNGCYQCVCTGSCLASHRDRYCCHNPSCRFHAPCPAPPEPLDQIPALPALPSTNHAPEAEAGALTGPSDTNETKGESSLTSVSNDASVIYRETITREWRLPDGIGAPAIELISTTAPRPTTSTASANVDRPSTPPARFTIEEYQAQARLLAQYQPRRDRRQQLGQREAETARNSRSGQETGRRPRVQILLD